MDRPVTCVVAEDEQLFRDALLELLRQEWPDLAIAAACEDGAAALEAIGEHKPDIAFLDIRMPGLTGLDVAAAASEVSPATQVVFVTAYDQYAIQAFERGAADYLLKPIVRERLVATIARLRSRLRNPTAQGEALLALVRELASKVSAKSTEPPLVWITASAGRETRLVMVDDVAYFKSDNKYTTVVTAQGESLLRTPLHELLAKLDPAHFRQIHRGTIVNLRMVSSIVRDENGRGTMRLANRPETLQVSLTFMPLFKNM
jgi:DNA-binding LytR/AlgR family response regulator